jgi:hypothetical protein
MAAEDRSQSQTEVAFRAQLAEMLGAPLVSGENAPYVHTFSFICLACKGTGRRGRGVCRRCHGDGSVVAPPSSYTITVHEPRGSWTDASGTYRFRQQLDGSLRFWKYDGKRWRPRKTVPIDVMTLLNRYDVS